MPCRVSASAQPFAEDLEAALAADLGARRLAAAEPVQVMLPSIVNGSAPLPPTVVGPLTTTQVQVLSPVDLKGFVEAGQAVFNPTTPCELWQCCRAVV